MNPPPDSSTIKRSLSAHAAVGLLAGALLYLVCLTGTILVFYEEWQRLEQGTAPALGEIRPDAVQRGVAAVLAKEAGKTPTSHLYVHLPEENLPHATVTTDTQAVHLDGAGNIAGKEENGWSEFLYDLHYALQLPGIVGGAIVGALGVMMLALSLSGVIAHPRIFRDAFRLRARNPGGIALADWHNRLGVWTLPFAVAIALTGAVIGLAALTAQGIASRYYHGDIEAAYAPIFGEEGRPDKAPAPLPDLAAALQYMSKNYKDISISYVIVHDPLTVGQEVQLIGKHPRRLIFGEYYAFDAKGRFLRTAGLADGELGQQAAASIYNLHFGNYGGLPVKILYFVLGLAVTAICATGTYIWLGKRRRRGHDEPHLRAAWDGVVWATPLALTLTFIARFVLGNEVQFGWIFWGTLVPLLGGTTLLAKRIDGCTSLQVFLVSSIIAAGALSISQTVG